MRFMMMIKSNEASEAGMPPSPEMMAAVGRFAEEMIRDGVVLDTAGLLPSSKGAQIRAAGGRLSVIDGPFAEAKELIGGYAIIRAKSRDEAIEHGKRFMSVHIDVLGHEYEGEMEIRQLAEFDPEFDGQEPGTQAAAGR